jgi:MOSC domain-containing protein YiiM
MKGWIYQISVSGGGVPKMGVEAAEVTVKGIVGDRQRNRRFHGGPRRAVCLFSWERIEALQGEGHPIYPGSIGENLTVAGLDWEQVVPGVQLRLGEEVVLEITSYTVPCKNIADSFREGEMGRVSQKLYPGWSRVYARVVQPGLIRTGDFVQFITKSYCL